MFLKLDTVQVLFNIVSCFCSPMHIRINTAFMSYGAVNRYDFYPIFSRLAEVHVSRSESVVKVVTRSNLTIGFQFIKPIQFYHCAGKCHCDLTILT